MSETLQIILAIVGVVGGINTLGLALIAFYTRRLNIEQERRATENNIREELAAYKVEEKVEEVRKEAVEAARKVEEVRKTVEVTSDIQSKDIKEVKKVVDATHAFGNSLMGVQLESNMLLSEFKAETTKKEVDIRAAEIARKNYEIHQATQASIDAKVNK